jgi:hypothetical protein
MALQLAQSEVASAYVATAGASLARAKAAMISFSMAAENSVSHQERKLIVTSQFPSTQPRKE